MATITITPGWAGPLAGVGSAPVVVQVAGVGPAGPAGAAGPAGPSTVSDAVLSIFGSVDNTKLLAFDVDTNVPTGTTVTLSAPATSGTIALTTDVLPVYARVKNVSGGSLSKGTPVYASGMVGSTSVVEVQAARSDDPAKIAIAVLAETLGVNAQGLAQVVGELTATDTGTLSLGSVWLAAAGGLTNTKPTTGTVQYLGEVTRVNSNTGVVHVNVSSPGTPANSYDLLSTLVSAEVSVTSGTTLTSTAFGKMHVCSGTSADYTVVLPAASGNAGKFIGFRMADGLTKLVTIDGDSSETIDGVTTRVLWAQEVAILLCDGTGWAKVAGRSRPFATRLSRTTDSTGISSSTWTGIAMTTQVFGPSVMFASSSAIAPRTAVYSVSVSSYLNGTGMSYSYHSIFLNGSHASNVGVQQSSVVSNTSSGSFVSSLSLSAGDALQPAVYHDGANTVKILGAGGSFITFTEIPQW